MAGKKDRIERINKPYLSPKPLSTGWIDGCRGISFTKRAKQKESVPGVKRCRSIKNCVSMGDTHARRVTRKRQLKQKR